MAVSCFQLGVKASDEQIVNSPGLRRRPSGITTTASGPLRLDTSLASVSSGTDAAVAPTRFAAERVRLG